MAFLKECGWQLKEFHVVIPGAAAAMTQCREKIPFLY
jgi:hypothetical protein